MSSVLGVPRAPGRDVGGSALRLCVCTHAVETGPGAGPAEHRGRCGQAEAAGSQRAGGSSSADGAETGEQEHALSAGTLGGGRCTSRIGWVSVRNVQFPVKVCRSAVEFHMRGKPKSVTVETKPGQAIADFKKSRDGFILLVPGN